MAESVRNALPIVTGAFFLLALLFLLIALRLFRRSRTDVFWRRRREAGQRGWRLFVLAFGLLVFSGLACTFTVLSALLFGDEEETPALIEIFSPNDLPSVTPTVTLTPGAGDVPTDSATVDTPGAVADGQTPEMPSTVVVIVTATPFTPTVTVLPTFTPYVTPLESNVTPLPGADIQITALDDQISDALTPVNPRLTFDAGTTRIYLFVEFKGMAQGVLWKRLLYRNGEVIDGNSYLWGQATEGTSYLFFGNDSGFSTGDYEIRLFVGDSITPVSVMPFTIVESP